MDDTIHLLTTKFLKSLGANLGKTASKSSNVSGSEILADHSLQIIIHMISCTRSLREAIEAATGVSTVPNDGSNSAKKPKNNIHNQLFLPLLNGILALLGKMLMDSFTFEPKVTDAAAFTAAYGVLGRHILNLFPEMATKKHKTSGKMLIHHAVFKARPAIAEETVSHILRGEGIDCIYRFVVIRSEFCFFILFFKRDNHLSVPKLRAGGGCNGCAAAALGHPQP